MGVRGLTRGTWVLYASHQAEQSTPGQPNARSPILRASQASRCWSSDWPIAKIFSQTGQGHSLPPCPIGLGMGTGVPLVAQVISDGLASGVATAGFTSSLPPSPSLARIRQLDDPSSLDLYHCTSFVLINPPLLCLSIIMARGNQREKARQANLKEQAKKVRCQPPISSTSTRLTWFCFHHL